MVTVTDKRKNVINMKKTRSYSSAILFLSVIMAISACNKADSELDYGTTTIYMPQAVIRSGGVNNQYPVPTGTDSSTWNYAIDAAKSRIDISMGAALSGPGSEAFTVEVRANTDTIQQLLAAGVFNPATHVLMPASMYTMPVKVDGVKGARAGFFKLSVDYKALKSAAYAGKFLLLAVKFANPTTYQLNSPLSSAIVVVDVMKIP